MRILLTGATGFVGGHTARGLLQDGHSVGAIVRPGSDLSALDPRVAVLVHDGSAEGLYDEIKTFAPDAGVHLASKFVAQHQPGDIGALIEANLHFGCQLLDALARCGVTRLVNIGTSWEHYESENYRPVSLYAATKHAFQDLCAFYADAHGMRIVTLKLSDTYGPGDTRPKLFALLCRIVRTGETLELSPGAQSINFAHVDDVVEAIRIALARADALPDSTMESFAVRGAEQLNLRDFVALFVQVAGTPLNVVWAARSYREREVMHPWLGQVLPGWQPKTTLQDGLRRMLTDV